MLDTKHGRRKYSNHPEIFNPLMFLYDLKQIKYGQLAAKKKIPGHESLLTFFSIHKQFRLGKLPHSIDSDNKRHCPVNICFPLPP